MSHFSLTFFACCMTVAHPLYAFEMCDLNLEKQFKNNRQQCNYRPNKALKRWKALETAQSEVIKLLERSKIEELMQYTACDASDVTNSEIICEYDYGTIGK